MKKIFAGTPHTKFIAAASALTWAIAMANSAGAAQLQEARVTQVVNDVKLLLEQSAPRPAAISDLIRHGTAVRTGTQSRSELTFADLTITRLGANTIFSFKEGTREMTLIDGAILFQVPKGSGGATIRTVGVTAAITGTTGIAEFHPATSSHPQLSKWLCLEGTFHLYLPNGQSVELGPGKIVTADGKSFSKVSTFDIAKLTSTSLFFTGFDQPLASMNLIMLESQNQVAGLLANTTNPLDPTRIVNVTSQAIVAEETPPPSVSPTVSPTVPPPPPTPSKFGTPSVISSPVPYLVTNGTVITTDPSITTNGVTDYGKIYRGQTDDGAFSLWAFGSTSAFDTALRIDDTFFADPSHLPIAVFKFERLLLTGDPTIDTTNGVSKLGLIGVDGITSGPPGGTLKFTGLDLLLLATVNGSINLTSNVSFQDLHELVMYARGAGSDLTINSPISNVAILGLVAEDSLHLTNPGTMSVGKLDAITGGDLVLQIGGSLLLNDRVRLDAIVLPGASVASGANLTLNVAGDYTNNSATESSRLAITNRSHIGTGGNIGVNIGGDLTAMNDFNLVVQNTNGQIDNGGNITLEVGGGINVAGALDTTLDNSSAGQIGGNALINFGVSGDINIAGGTLIQVKNELDSGVSATHGGTIGGDSSISISASNMSTEGFFVSLLNENDHGGTGTAGGHIGGAASIAINVNGALTTHANNPNPDVEPGAFDLFIDNYGFSDGSSGGFIGSNASVSIAAASISTAADFNIGIDNSAGGTIGGAARLNVTAGSMSVDEFSAGITNGNLNVTTESRPAGHIAGAASITLNITGALNVAGGTDNDMDEPSAMSFQIDNRNFSGSPGGSIGSDASIDVTAGSISDNGDALRLRIFNSGAGMIGGNASIVVAANSISAAGPGLTGAGENLNLLIDNSAAGNINGSATISLTAGSVSTTGSFNATIGNSSGGTIGGTANVAVNIGNDVTAPGGVTLQILNGNGGHIGTGTAGDGVLYSVGGSTSTTNLTEYVDNSNGGAIDNGGTVTLHTVGPVMLDGGLLLEMDNFNGGTINNGADVTAHFVGDLTATLGSQHSFNFFVVNGDTIPSQGFTGGTIGTGGNINLTFDGNAETIPTPDTGAFAAQISNVGGSIGTGGNISVAIGGNETNGNVLSIAIFNDQGHIGTGGNIAFHVTGDVTDAGSAFLGLRNEGGTIGSSPVVDISAHNFFINGGNLDAQIDNSSAGMMGGHAGINFTISGGISTAGNMNVSVFNGGGGTIGGDTTINVSAGNISIGTPLAPADLGVFIGNTSGSIGGSVATNLTVSGDITVADAINAFLNNGGATSSPGSHITGDATINVLGATGINAGNGAFFGIVNEDAGAGTFGGTIDGNALVHVTADHLTTEALAPSDFNLFGTIHNRGGSIVGNSDVMFDISGAITTAGRANFDILNFDDGGVNGGGIIGGAATVNVSANSLTTTQGDAGFAILNGSLGSIGGSAIIGLSLTGDLTTQGDANFIIGNQGSASESGGTIGSDAVINLGASNISTGGHLDVEIDNEIGFGGAPGGTIGGTIGGNARIDVNAANLNANSLLAQIDNTGGSIGANTEGGATINMNVSGTATVTNDATVAIYGSDGAVGSAGININGGSYSVGGTFLSYIDGNGTITFNNASAHADVLKAGVFGANGVLNIGGGTLSADSTLKLYAPGSNGALNFVSNVTLGGNSLKILAANSVTIFNNVVVTIGGPNPADVYTNNPNYTGFGGNKSTTGTFAGAGANDPQPLINAPPFGPASPGKVMTGGNITTGTRIPRLPSTSGKKIDNVINVRSSDELLSLLDGAAPGPGGKITVPPSKSTSNSRNSNRTDVADRLKAGSRVNADRRAMDMRTVSSSVIRRSPQ